MKPLVFALGFGAALLFSSAMTFAMEQEEGAGAPAANTLTQAQKDAGWMLLFDGRTPKGWRSYRGKEFPSNGWTVEDGALHVRAGVGSGDIVADRQFQDFDLRLEWKVSEHANSGIMYRVTEEEQNSWQTGPEYQILDDMGHGVPPDNPHSAGALYDLMAPPAHKVARPAGEWNQTRIVLQESRVQHWLNGVLLLECDLGGKEGRELIANSKFSVYPQFGRNAKGFIALQDHGHAVWFRNIRIRDLTLPPGQKEIALFNGTDMTGWEHYLPEGGPMDSVWSVQESVIVCQGQPAGYIQTAKDYKNFILKLRWRFSPATKQSGNSGVLLRKTGADQIWPRCLEAQLLSGYAGDFWVIEEFPVKTAPERTNGRNTQRTHCNENAVGEWNDYEITVDGGDVTLVVNGEVLNKASEAEEIAGRICLQSEGVEIHFKDIQLIPLD